MKINILGSEWNVEYRNADADSQLKENDGYTDHSVKLIVIANKKADCEIQDFQYMQKENLRHIFFLFPAQDPGLLTSIHSRQPDPRLISE